MLAAGSWLTTGGDQDGVDSPERVEPVDRLDTGGGRWRHKLTDSDLCESGQVNAKALRESLRDDE
jgi:hypothetical protein